MPESDGSARRGTSVPLREYLDEKIDSDRQTNRERFGFVIALGCTIWFFIERHLKELNHENARVAKVSENSVSADTYSATEAQRKAELGKLDEWRKEVDADRGRSISRDEFQKDNRETVRFDSEEVRAVTASKRGTWTVGLQIAVTCAALVTVGLLLFTTYRAIKPAVPSLPSTTTVFVQTSTVPAP